MLLNNFLYTRSLLKNEHFQNRLKFSSLVPKTSIYDAIENPFEKEEHIEEIKDIIINGGKEELDEEELDEEELDEEELDELKEEVEECENDKNELKEEVEECENDKTELKEEVEECKNDKNELKESIEEYKTDKEELIEMNDKLKEKIIEKEEGEEEEKKIEKDLEKIKKAIAYIGSKKGGGEEIDNAIQHKDVIFDNLTKGGGEKNSDKDVKNVVVSFF
tara:strand:- start:10505 stop:11164 length:660 start_codon:yes stop_codon:yes gene_type:complete